jgi:hypothetical protein
MNAASATWHIIPTHPGPPNLPNPAEALRRHPRVLRRAISSISLYGPGEGEGYGEAEGDAVGEGDGEAVGDAVGLPVVAGPVEGTGVVVGSIRSRRGVGSYGPLSAADNAATTTTAASKHAGASTSTRGTRTNGRTQPSKTYHNNAANTTTTGTDTHHGKPRMNGPSRSPNCPIAAPRSDALASTAAYL